MWRGRKRRNVPGAPTLFQPPSPTQQPGHRLHGLGPFLPRPRSAQSRSCQIFCALSRSLPPYLAALSPRLPAARADSHSEILQVCLLKYDDQNERQPLPLLKVWSADWAEEGAELEEGAIGIRVSVGGGAPPPPPPPPGGGAGGEGGGGW